jgi:hypothetical protein
MIFMGNSCGPTLIVTDPPVGWSKIRENVLVRRGENVLVRRKNLICAWLEAECKTRDLFGEQLLWPTLIVTVPPVG